MGTSIWRSGKHVGFWWLRQPLESRDADGLQFSVAFGYIQTRLTAAKEEGAFVSTPDGEKIALGIPRAQKEATGQVVFGDIPLRRPGTATEAASAILAVASPYMSYVSGQTLSVTGGRNI